MIVKSQAANVDPPIVSLPEYLLQHTESHGDRIALIDGPSGRSYTYRQFTAHVRSFAANLCARGFQKGDSFAIYSPNQPEYAIAFIGIALAGGIVTTVNPLYTAEELTRQLEDASASCHL